MTRNGVHRMVGGAGGEGQHLKAVPAEHALRRCELGLTPIAVHGGTVAAAVDLDAVE
jgi:hypothetical protein